MPESPTSGIDRRRARRRRPAADEPLARVRLRAGRELLVVDVSSAGALVEGAARLLPGTHVDVHLVTTDGRMLVRSRVVRAYVHRLEAEMIRYRGALAFERSIDTAFRGNTIPDLLVDVVPTPGTAYPADAPALPQRDGQPVLA